MPTSPQHQQHRHQHQHQAPVAPHENGHEHPGQLTHDEDQSQLLDLDAAVMAEHTAAVTAWLPVRAVPGAIVDLGAGTGTGTFALLRQFPTAHVTAVDSSGAHLQRLRSTANAAGLGDRVRTVQADLDAGDWPSLGRPDLVWASASMHHLQDPDRALRQLRDLLAPNGLIAVVELPGFPRFLPPDAPADRPGLEERCHAAIQTLHAQLMPHRGADWGPMLVAAGLVLEDQLDIAVEIEASADNAVGPYALATLQRLRATTAALLPAEDVAALDQLLDTTGPRSILRRADLAARTTRSVWAARRTGPNEWFSAAAEAATCERVAGDRRHGLDVKRTGWGIA